MKQFIFAALAILACACNKDMSSAPGGPADASDKTYKVSFSLKDFIIEQNDMGKAGARKSRTGALRDSSLNGIKYIYYAVYDKYNARMHFRQQSPATPDSVFGQFIDSLPEGNYTISIAASTRPIVFLADTLRTPNTPHFGFHEIQPELHGGTLVNVLADIFYKKMSLTVSPLTGHTDYPLTLDRIVGKLILHTPDGPPASSPYATNFLVHIVQPSPFSYRPIDGAVLQTPQAPPVIARRMSKYNQFLHEDYMFGSSQTVTVNITYNNIHTGAPMSKTINNVPVSANKVTVITGYLFGDPSQQPVQGFQVKANQLWNSDTTHITF